MPRKTLLRPWLLALLVSTAISLLAYAWALPGMGHPPYSALAWFLWPGVALYTWLNGSLLLGGGFGRLGDAAIIVLGSAVPWSVLLAGLFRGFDRLRRHPRQS